MNSSTSNSSKLLLESESVYNKLLTKEDEKMIVQGRQSADKLHDNLEQWPKQLHGIKRQLMEMNALLALADREERELLACAERSQTSTSSSSRLVSKPDCSEQNNN